MSKLMLAMKDEIRRIARKEIRAAVGGLKKDRVVLKRTVAELKRQVKAERKVVKALAAAVTRQTRQVALPEAGAAKARVTAKGVRALRRKLKLSQADFGKLLGVNGITIMKWEHRSGPLQLRPKSRQAYLAIRNISVKEAKLRLGR
jgi:DNA-binding transcriptional regulator YiaG